MLDPLDKEKLFPVNPPCDLRILCIEKHSGESLPIVEELRRSGYAPRITRVTSEADLRGQMTQPEWDAVIVDFHAPAGGLTGVQIVRETDHEVPVILICETATRESEDALRHGANDYISYANFARIGSIIRRELLARKMRAERSVTEDKLRKSTKQLDISFSILRASVEVWQEGVAILDASGRVLIVNKRFLEFTGLDAGSTKGAHWEDVAKKFRAALQDPEPWDELANSPKDEITPYVILERGDFRLEACATPCLDRKEYVGRIWRLRDVTEREHNLEMRLKREQKLSQSQKMDALGVLAGGMAHDFNNFLAIILNNAELVRASLATEGKVKHNMDNLLAALGHAAVLVRQVLQFSRRDRHHVFRKLNLETAIPQIITAIKPELPSDARLIYRAGAHIPPISGDIDQIRQIVKNLCLNSVQAIGDGAVTIEIDLAEKEVTAPEADEYEIKAGAYAVLSISDNGPGIAPETLSRIFEPFFTTKPVGTGSGLGLPVVHGLVRAHGGIILASSSSNGGATFRVYFPSLQQTEMRVSSSEKKRIAEHAAKVTATAPEKKHAHATVMVMDDDEAIATVTSEILTMLGFETVTFTNPLEALKAFQANPKIADLMLADVNMPGLDGVNLAREMLKCRPGFPILLLSGYSGRWTLEAVRELGIVDMLPKPLSAQTLGAAIHKALDEATSTEA